MSGLACRVAGFLSEVFGCEAESCRRVKSPVMREPVGVDADLKLQPVKKAEGTEEKLSEEALALRRAQTLQSLSLPPLEAKPVPFKSTPC